MSLKVSPRTAAVLARRPAVSQVALALLALAMLQGCGSGLGAVLLPGETDAQTVAPDREAVVTEQPLQKPEQPAPSRATVEQDEDGSWTYVVNGQPQLFIGMGYNAIYRDLPDEERAARYDRDFRTLCEAGVNHITGWDKDKGYEQDRFDELTLDTAQRYGLGVVMPFYLPPEADYGDAATRQALLDQARTKIERFKGHPALRMWGVGNEVLTEMPRTMDGAFCSVCLELVDLFHELDPDHPVIYRGAEDVFLPTILGNLERSGDPRPWLLYGMNVYSLRLESMLQAWAEGGPARPLLVSEFGAEPEWFGSRAEGYVHLWRTLRSYPDFVLGGAPYVWTTEGPEPVDKKWGLMDGDGTPVDDTFALLKQEWLQEAESLASCSG